MSVSGRGTALAGIGGGGDGAGSASDIITPAMFYVLDLQSGAVHPELMEPAMILMWHLL